MATTPRSLRIPEDTWSAAVAATREAGTTVTAVATAALEDFVKAYTDDPAISLRELRNAYTRIVRDELAAHDVQWVGQLPQSSRIMLNGAQRMCQVFGLTFEPEEAASA